MLIKQARRVIVFVIGSTIVLLGVLLLFLPGPGSLIMIGGLAVLGTEFAWATWLMKRLKRQAAAVVNAVWHQGKVEAESTPQPTSERR